MHTTGSKMGNHEEIRDQLEMTANTIEDERLQMEQIPDSTKQNNINVPNPEKEAYMSVNYNQGNTFRSLGNDIPISLSSYRLPEQNMETNHMAGKAPMAQPISDQCYTDNLQSYDKMSFPYGDQNSNQEMVPGRMVSQYQSSQSNTFHSQKVMQEHNSILHTLATRLNDMEQRIQSQEKSFRIFGEL